MENIVQKAKELVSPFGTLIYLVTFGSHLYGTNTATSDHDYKGIFIPHKEHMLLGRKSNAITTSTGDDVSKNTQDDIDIQLWSLQHWLNLLQRGDTNAIDLLYSPSNLGCLLYDKMPSIEGLYSPITVPSKYINVKDNRSYIGYIFQQAKKYGLKGSRMDVLQGCLATLAAHFSGQDLEEIKFKDAIPVLLEAYPDTPLVTLGADKQGKPILWILGKGYHEGITLHEAYSRLQTAWNTYGTRAQQAQKNEGVDWKAISHALRCLYQVQELVETGHIVFPLKDATFLLQVKQGLVDWEECNKLLSEGIDAIENKLAVLPNNEIQDAHEQYILGAYDEFFS